MIKSQHAIVAVVTMASPQRSKYVACVTEFKLDYVSISTYCTICLQKRVMYFLALHQSSLIFSIELAKLIGLACKVVFGYDSGILGSRFDHEEVYQDMYNHEEVDKNWRCLLKHRPQNKVVKCTYDRVDEPKCVEEFSWGISTYYPPVLILFTHEGKLILSCVNNVSQNGNIFVRLL